MPLMPTDVDIKIWLKQNHDWLHDCMCHFRKHDLFITIGLFCTIFQVTGKPSSNYGVQDYATSEKENVKYSVIGRRVFSCRNLRAYILFWFNVILWFLTQHPSHIEYGHDNVIKWKHVPRVTGPLCGKFTGYRWIPLTKASDAKLWCFLWSVPD